MKPAAVVSSSPVRAEKLPAPGLAHLLRGKNASNRSRGARSSPIFSSRTKSVGRSSSSSRQPPAVPEADEPSSPKVTCIGQVRIRNRNRNRKKNKKNKQHTSRKTQESLNPPSPQSRRCCCRRHLNNLFCFSSSKKKDPPPSSSSCSCRFLFWQNCCSRKTRTAEEAAAPPPIAFVAEVIADPDKDYQKEEDEDADDDDGNEEETKVFVPSAAPPPKNALLLMRCRSAPHNRSSALATCRFEMLTVPPASESEEEHRGERGDQREDERGSAAAAENLQQPSALMRCKSEPAVKGEKLMEVSYCKFLSGSGGERERRQMAQGELLL